MSDSRECVPEREFEIPPGVWIESERPTSRSRRLASYSGKMKTRTIAVKRQPARKATAKLASVIRRSAPFEEKCKKPQYTKGIR